MASAPRPLAILVTGDPVEPVLRKRGTFVSLMRAALGQAWSGAFLELDARSGFELRPGELGALVITGSPSSVASREDWIVRSERQVAACVEAGLPTLGICFGHQLLAQALGGNVAVNPNGREMGSVEVELVERDPLFEGAPERFAVNMSHVDTAERLPEGARVLGRTARDRHAAVRFAERAWGFQFHPEFDGDVVRGYVEARAEQIRREGLEPASFKLADAPDSVALFRRFARLASGG